MATLTGQQIKDTYDGLLKLNDSTTGITNSLQAITDGLGNNTGSKISTNYFTAPNQLAFYHNIQQSQYGGLGCTNTVGAAMVSGAQSNLLWNYFYDAGVASYSAITVFVNTFTTTSDVVETLFYDLQFVDEYGLFPCNQIMSGITIPTGSNGFQTVTLPSTLSFSGKGGGFYAVVVKITNAGVTPTIRFGGQVFSINNQSFLTQMGIVRNNGGTSFQAGNRTTLPNGQNWFYLTNQTTPQTITAADVATRFNTNTFSQPVMGFNLHTIR